MNIYKEIYDLRVKDSEESRKLVVAVCERICSLVVEEANLGKTTIDSRRALNITREAIRQITQQSTVFQRELQDILDKHAQANEQTNEKTISDK